MHNVRLEAKAKAEFKLSVEAAGRRELNKSARLNAGGGDVAAEEVAIDPEDDRRAVSAFHVSRCDKHNDDLKMESLESRLKAYHHRGSFAQNPSFQK